MLSKRFHCKNEILDQCGVHAFNASTQETERQADLCDFQISLIT